MSLTADQRRALRLLASDPQGATEALMLAHGFRREMLAGLATVVTEAMRAGAATIKVEQYRMTGATRFQRLGDAAVGAPPVLRHQPAAHSARGRQPRAPLWRCLIIRTRGHGFVRLRFFTIGCAGSPSKAPRAT